MSDLEAYQPDLAAGLPGAVPASLRDVAGVVDGLLDLDPSERAKVLSGLGAEGLEALATVVKYDYRLWRMRHQIPPPGGWRWWLLLGGRGAGKTWTGSTWLLDRIATGRYQWVTLVGMTRESVRKVMIDGPSGLLALTPPWMKVIYEPSKLLLTWTLPDGTRTVARIYSAEKPDRIRGEQHQLVWADEVAAWPKPESFDQIDIGLRLSQGGIIPQGLITTTPKSTALICDLALGPKRGKIRVPRKDVVVVKASTRDAVAVLGETYVAGMEQRYGQSRWGRQELEAELLEKTGEELFTEELIEMHRRSGMPKIVTCVVAVDPTRADDPTDECGIVIAARCEDGHCYVMDDRSMKASPLKWATAAVGAYHQFRADVLVYEKNRLGEQLEQTITLTDKTVKWKGVQAADGKEIRATPVSALMEQGKIHIVGDLPELEHELTTWSPGGGWSPGRLDAFVWAVTELMLGEQRPALVAR